MKFIPSRFRLLAVVVCLTLLSGVALAGPVAVNVFASISPDPFLSLSTYNLWAANALIALQAGTSANGTSGFPSLYSQVSSYAATDMIGASGFTYWRGQVTPTGNFAGQTGNMLVFGTTIFGNGTQFRTSDVTFTDVVNDSPAVVTALSTVGYGGRMVGINFGADGVLGGGDDAVYGGVPLTPGASSTLLVNALYFSGFGVQFGPVTLADLPADLALAMNVHTPSISGTYSVALDGGTANGSANIELVPEPATLTFGGIGVLLLGLAARRRRRV